MTSIRLDERVMAAIVAVIMFSGFSVSSSAALIDADSEMVLFGTYSPDNGNDLTGATTLSFGSPVVIAAGLGDFASAASSSATFSNVAFDPATPGTVMTFANGGSFTANSITIDFQTSTALDLTLSGFWSLNGFDDTLGSLVLTADSLGGLYTFSAAGTVQAIPVPAALWLFGSALAGLGMTRRRTA